MSFLKKIFGSTPQTPAPSEATPANPSPENDSASESTSSATPETVAAQETAPASETAATAEPAKPEMIRVVDADGRERLLTRPQWRDEVLLPHLREVWEEPDKLATAIATALDAGFLPDMLEPAEQLARIDTASERGAVILAIVYRELGRPLDSEKTLQAQIERQGESPMVLLQLAKAQFAQKENEQSLGTLWRALELEPNLEEAFGWYAARHHEQGGDAAALEAMRSVAALPHSWLARLGLARAALANQRLDEALPLYREALTLAPRPVPPALLMLLTGDLGNAGHRAELLALAQPLFDIAAHGLPVANNLLRANLELGRFDTGRALLDQLYGFPRPDWRPHLHRWDAEYARARLAAARAAAPGKMSLAMLVDNGPTWLPAGVAGALFPAADEAAPSIAFLGSSAAVPEPGAEGTAQVGDAAGRLSRAVPLFLAEQAYFGTRARVRPIVPWVQGATPAFVLGSNPWPADEAAQRARGLQPASDYIVVTHILAQAEPWRVELRLVRAADGVVVGTAGAELTLAEPEAALRGLAAELLELLRREAGATVVSPPGEYHVPAGAAFGPYLLRMEQLLAVGCQTLEGTPEGFLHGERELLDGLLQLNLAEPTNVVPRLMLVQALRRLYARRPRVVAEYRDTVRRLQQERPLAEPAQGVLTRLFDEIYA